MSSTTIHHCKYIWLLINSYKYLLKVLFRERFPLSYICINNVMPFQLIISEQAFQVLCLERYHYEICSILMRVLQPFEFPSSKTPLLTEARQRGLALLHKVTPATLRRVYLLHFGKTSNPAQAPEAGIQFKMYSSSCMFRPVDNLLLSYKWLHIHKGLSRCGKLHRLQV